MLTSNSEIGNTKENITVAVKGEDLNISFIHNWKEKENSGTESPNLYSDCIIYIGVKEGICMRIKGNPHPYCEPTPRS